MKYDPDKHHRRSIRLENYDYSQSGAYIVTICLFHCHECLFGDVVNGEMILNEYGKIVAEEWLKTPQIRPYIELDAYVVMPNHFHGILFIIKDDVPRMSDGRGMMHHVPTTNHKREFSKPIANSLSTIVGAFKASVTRQINRLRDTPGGILWQKNYYETIIRTEHMLDTRRQYIVSNPVKWENDENNPANIK
jgi:putative transposase